MTIEILEAYLKAGKKTLKARKSFQSGNAPDGALAFAMRREETLRQLLQEELSK